MTQHEITTRRPHLSVSEPRDGQRIRVSFDAQISSIEADYDASYTLATAATRDVADGGLGLRVDAPMRVGLRVVVAVQLADERWVERSGRVVWTSGEEAGACFVGIAFDEPLAGFAAKAGQH